MRVLCEFCHATRDDSDIPPHFNSHRKLGLRYLLTGRISQEDYDRFLWRG
jgi:hypothetical protein